ncbi:MULTISPECIES: lipopolysaccharide biosynthesis protein [unclassified Ensifer]|uniref:oligosaccharide flippase family protein n=1 Tax=unclassified Ensifer TaxID=2633371 RepID=UPI00081316DE|nr:MULTISPECIES: lipopolysaccharide biosynthesis protein [unclassified Ensifer]OCO99624.1 multi antimicrobial extrusion protein MatE [Ensifer sp. LC14]OCP02590.1 multi antimicrobial extrusion protein MatE [Ensifer sp. LC11]OCP02861.1 multi antimicrobial extrusion protein MatE [Ensifer sp. LC13]OCP29881.1 multi antimicrobial extrusion protein MatE [Ensifer sp. LC499]
MLPSALRHRLCALIGGLVAILTGSDAKSTARRMALVAFTVRIVSAAIAFLSQIILARLMGEFEYGIFVFVWVLVILFGSLSCVGFHSVVIRFLPEYQATAAMDEIRGVTTTVRVFALTSATAVAIVGLIGLWLFGVHIEAYYLVPLYLGLFTLPMISLGDVMDGTARAHGWALSALSPTFIIRPLLVLIFMVLAVVAGAPHTAKTAMVAAMAATYVTTISQFLVLTYRLRSRYVQGPRRIELRRWLKVSIPVFMVDGFGFLLTNSDVVIVGLYLEPDDVGIYFAAAKTMALVHFVMFAVKAAAGPRVSNAMARDPSQIAGIAIESARWAFWPSLLVGALVLLAGPLLLSLFGPAFVTGLPLMMILFAGILAKAFVGPAETLLTMAGQQTLCVVLYAGALLANIALNLSLIPQFGLSGAAFATAGAMFIEAMLLHIAVRHTFGFALFAFASARAGNDNNGAVHP